MYFKKKSLSIYLSIVSLSMMSAYNLEASAIKTASSPWQNQFTAVGKGTTLKFYPQDATVSLQDSYLQEVQSIYFPQAFADGPADSEMVIAQNRVLKTNFTKVTPRTPACDSVHTFACVRDATNMWRATLEILNKTFVSDPKIVAATQLWDSMPQGVLYISPEGIPDKNAFYSRDVRIINGKLTKVGELIFGSFDVGATKVHTNRSKDIVAHEAGHYCLDRLRPQFYDSTKLQTGAFHEAFGDITALSSIIDDNTMAEALITATKGDLHSYENFAARLAEEFGVSLGLKGPLRNMDAVYKLSKVDAEVHAVAEVFSSAYYTTLAHCFNDAVALNQAQFPKLTNVLQDISEYGRTLILGSIIDVKDDPDFSDLGAAFDNRVEMQRKQAPSHIAYLKDLKWSDYFIDELKTREVEVKKQIRRNFGIVKCEYNGHKCTAYSRPISSTFLRDVKEKDSEQDFVS